ncbi:MAG: Fe-S cluster assembly protein SufD [Chitinophagaceae bacterium]|nr:MAG: Fe-S cluster assembly protein SufD [Chitinophagaceae bacterium]
MDTIQFFKDKDASIDAVTGDNAVTVLQNEAIQHFEKNGIPTVKNEEWKYTRINDFFTKDFHFSTHNDAEMNEASFVKLPENETANSIVFVNGLYSSALTKIISPEVTITSIADAVNAGNEFVIQHLGSSATYHKDGINALNTAFAQQGLFVDIKKGAIVSAPIYIYNITNTAATSVLALPRILVHIPQSVEVTFVETYQTLGGNESFTNQVIEMVVEQNAIVQYCKIQNDTNTSSIVSTTHVHQIGTSITNFVTVTLDGNIVRNNLNMVMSAPHSNANMFGLYLQQGETHVDNHTIVDNKEPHCLSTELYKGILGGKSTGVFNGKIFVRQKAQKTNAFQSNRNVVLSKDATINTKPQLEIFADDVKCSHGCTVGRLDEEALFYMQSRGISEKTATKLLLNGFALDITEKIEHEAIRNYVVDLINHQLESMQ